MKIKIIVKFSLVLFLLSASAAQAGLVPCGLSENDPSTPNDEEEICTLCHLIVGFKGLIDYGLKIMFFVALAGLVVAAVMYVVSAGSENIISTAKTFIKNILYGFAIVLLAWLFIFAAMSYLAVEKNLGIGKEGGWNKFECVTKSRMGELYSKYSKKDENQKTSVNLIKKEGKVDFCHKIGEGAQCVMPSTTFGPSGTCPGYYQITRGLCPSGQVCCDTKYLENIKGSPVNFVKSCIDFGGRCALSSIGCSSDESEAQSDYRCYSTNQVCCFKKDKEPVPPKDPEECVKAGGVCQANCPKGRIEGAKCMGYTYSPPENPLQECCKP